MVLVKDASGSRAAKLIKSFWAITKGEQQITNAHSAKFFLQACQAFSDTNTAVKCVEVLVSNTPPYLQRLGEVFDTRQWTPEARFTAICYFGCSAKTCFQSFAMTSNLPWAEKKSKRKPVTLGEIKLVNIDVDKTTMRHIHPYSLFVDCGQGVNFPRNISRDKKVAFVANSKHFMKHDCFGALCCDDKIIAFGSLVRNDANLLKSPPIVGLRFTDSSGLKSALAAFESPIKDQLKFLIVGTATFAYEPILERLKTTADLPLEAQLIDHEQPSLDVLKPIKLDALLDRCRTTVEAGSRIILPLNFTRSKEIHLQDAQLKSFIHGLSSDLALIQGPPGTGKSYLGAIILLTILRLTTFRVLVLSYTNQSLCLWVSLHFNFLYPYHDLLS